MQIPKMTDKQLQLAIAEELGWKHCSNCCGKESSIWPLPNVPHVHDPSGDVKELGLLPNYPCDNDAAIGLPLETNEEKIRFACELGKIIIPDINIGTAAIIYEARFATARQHSEAWLTARRNDERN